MKKNGSTDCYSGTSVPVYTGSMHVAENVCSLDCIGCGALSFPPSSRGVCIGFLLLGVRSNGEDCRAHPSSPVRLPGEVIGSEPSLPVSTRMIYVFVLHV